MLNEAKAGNQKSSSPTPSTFEGLADSNVRPLDSTKLATRAMYNQLGAAGMRAWVDEYGMADEMGFVLSMIGAAQVVLDLGCGYGRTAVPLALRGLTVHGLDISESLIASAREFAAANSVSPQFDVGDMCQLRAYNDLSFDHVLCLWSSFIHIVDEAEQLRCINEVHRVLKPGASATFVLTDPDLSFWQERLSKTTGRVVPFEPVEGHCVSVFIHNQDSVRALMAKSEFDDYDFCVQVQAGEERQVLSMRKAHCKGQ